MPDIDVDDLTFCFPEGWQVTKFDDWAFYRNQFSKMHDNIKAVDVLAISPEADTLWMIEVKDFRKQKRAKSEPLHEEIWKKVFASLAALLPAQANSTNTNEERFAEDALCVSHIRVAFYGEQPKKPSKLFPLSYNIADLQQKFKSLFKAIDPHALVVNSSKMPDCIPWTVKL